MASAEEMKNRIQELEEMFHSSELKCAELKGAVRSSREQVVVRTKPEAKIRKFAENDDIEDWIDSVKSQLKNCTTAREEVDFLMNHLEKKPYREVRLKIDRKTAKAHNVLETLVEIYGSRKTGNELQEDFYTRQQLNGESIDDYAYALMDLMINIENKSSMKQDEVDEMLKSRLANGASNLELKYELQRLNREREFLTFIDLRNLARQWLKGHGTSSSAVSIEAASIERNKWEEMKQILTDQQQQISRLVEKQQVSVSSEHSYSSDNFRGDRHVPRGSYQGQYASWQYDNRGNNSRGNYVHNHGYNSRERDQGNGYQGEYSNPRGRYNYTRGQNNGDRNRGSYQRFDTQVHQTQVGQYTFPEAQSAAQTNWGGQHQSNAPQSHQIGSTPPVARNHTTNGPTRVDSRHDFYCYYCKEPNHVARNCVKRHEDNQNYSSNCYHSN